MFAHDGPTSYLLIQSINDVPLEQGVQRIEALVLVDKEEVQKKMRATAVVEVVGTSAVVAESTMVSEAMT